MNLKEAILKEHSKNQTMKIVRWVGSDKKRFSELMMLYLTGENIIKQRASWPFSYSAVANPKLVKPHLKKLMENLKNTDLHDGIKRNTLLILQETDIPEDLQGLAAEICFSCISSAKESIAAKCYAITTATKICKPHPKLARELRMIIEAMLPYTATAGIKVRAKRAFKELALA